MRGRTLFDKEKLPARRLEYLDPAAGAEVLDDPAGRSYLKFKPHKPLGNQSV
jgi:hypothetical protein